MGYLEGVILLGGIQVELWRFIIAVLSIILGFMLRRVSHCVCTRLKHLSGKTKNPWDNLILFAVERPLGLALIVAGVGIAALILPFPSEPLNLPRFILAVLKAFCAAIVVWVTIRFVDGLTDVLSQMARKTETKLDDQILPIFRASTKVIAVLIGAMVVIQNLGYSIGSLLAGLGLGGAALALASKDTFANLFGSLVVFIDRPFQIGDWVEIGNIEGTVEEVGLRITRIRTFANSMITLPNHILTTSAIENWSGMQKRRIKTMIGITYDSQPEQVAKCVDAFRDVLRNDDRIEQSLWMVNFRNFGPYSLDIFVYCFTKTTNWAEHLQIRQEIFLQFMQEVHRLGLSFAFPSQSVYLESLPQDLARSFSPPSRP